MWAYICIKVLVMRWITYLTTLAVTPSICSFLLLLKKTLFSFIHLVASHEAIIAEMPQEYHRLVMFYNYCPNGSCPLWVLPPNGSCPLRVLSPNGSCPLRVLFLSGSCPLRVFLLMGVVPWVLTHNMSCPLAIIAI